MNGIPPSNGGSPIVSNQVKRLFTVMQTNGFNVGDKLIKPVALDAFRFRGLAVAAQVRYADSIPSVCKRFDLVAPSVPAFWKPMQQNDEFRSEERRVGKE